MVPLGGDRRPITILFSDIRGFTSMAESMRPDAIAQLLTEYFSEMVEIIFEHGGTLDKFVGDSVMALWGAPIAHADDPDRALRAAVAMQHAHHAGSTSAGSAPAGRRSASGSGSTTAMSSRGTSGATGGWSTPSSAMR